MLPRPQYPQFLSRVSWSWQRFCYSGLWETFGCPASGLPSPFFLHLVLLDSCSLQLIPLTSVSSSCPDISFCLSLLIWLEVRCSCFFLLLEAVDSLRAGTGSCSSLLFGSDDSIGCGKCWLNEWMALAVLYFFINKLIRIMLKKKRMSGSRPQYFFFFNWTTETQRNGICLNFMKLVYLEAGARSELGTFIKLCFSVAMGFRPLSFLSIHSLSVPAWSKTNLFVSACCLLKMLTAVGLASRSRGRVPCSVWPPTTAPTPTTTPAEHRGITIYNIKN